MNHVAEMRKIEVNMPVELFDRLQSVLRHQKVAGRSTSRNAYVLRVLAEAIEVEEEQIGGDHGRQ